MERVLGYTVQLRKSNIPEAGTGVFVSKGMVTTGSIVALYHRSSMSDGNYFKRCIEFILHISSTGTVYRVMEPLLLQSIVNPFIFRCIDGLHIDGKDRGISRKIFK